MQHMFCYQCEQTASGIGCTQTGVCGRTPLLSLFCNCVEALTLNLAQFAERARQENISLQAVNRLTCEALYATMTHVCYSEAALNRIIQRLLHARDALARQLHVYAIPFVVCDGSVDSIMACGRTYMHNLPECGCSSDYNGLRHTLLYAIKGVCAYAEHCLLLDARDDMVFEFVHRALARLCDPCLSREELWALCMECGKVNLLQMHHLSSANTEHFGPFGEYRKPLRKRFSKSILVSGHDFYSLWRLLQAVEASSIGVYVHCEMEPSLAYEKIGSHPNMAGHYGSAWQNQREEFSLFPGAILVTDNCMQIPAPAYEKRFFTTHMSQFPGINHITNGDFEPLIACALSLPAFDATSVTFPAPPPLIGRVLLQDQISLVAQMIRTQKLRKIICIGGCNGTDALRDFFTEKALRAPQDALILTWGCCKFRLAGLPVHELAPGLPSIVDAGQCHDVVGIIHFLTALRHELNVSYRQLPLEVCFSWFEQKSVAVLLTWLSMGIRPIMLGPRFPAFWGDETRAFAASKFELQGVPERVYG